MQLIHLGQGPRWRQWLETTDRSPEMRSAAVVHQTQADRQWFEGRFPALSTSAFANLGDALNSTRADAVILTGVCAARQAVDALTAGLAVLIDKPYTISSADLRRLNEAAQQSGRPVMVAQNYPYERCEAFLHTQFAAGKIGAITHVSCMDWRPLAAHGELLEDTRPHLSLIGCDHLCGLRRILGVDPISVTARTGEIPWDANGQGRVTEAFLEMENSIHVQYFGSATTSRKQHVLWIEGQDGAIKTDGTNVWWRKRGWRLFAPAHWPKFSSGSTAADKADAKTLEELSSAIGRSNPNNKIQDLLPISMMAAAVESDERKQPIQIKELLAGQRLDS